MVGDFEVHLAPLSLDQLNVFLEIEGPEAGPLPLPVLALMERQPEFATIGQFYHSIIEKIKELGNGIFTGAASQADRISCFRSG